MVALGKNIQQQSENIFDEIKNEIRKQVENENDKNELLTYVNEMEKSKNNKETFRSYYDKFINRLGIYMSIFGPFLPYLVEYFK
jgi:flagellar hook-associated protein FlgK